ncbi:hypothetical protein K437DRAFT_255292 [Tilletiaria anomala UBC 951]|uniref:Uncharacterized protein n=1 Tax=Tilletiaria anomala (strain ATCC 24038 / CBS 436.72 / UBC 951) TaxID=1037660 RepID=A0A066W785_TILAU|nr:uncharacterized protein K437DRAFT_255292 [Tilletiaria anomala UBC 951]KDN49611.1 hypothetical protein K437DRAFT_255292 [Tilletiaria anomala UBC 951]
MYVWASSLPVHQRSSIRRDVYNSDRYSCNTKPLPDRVQSLFVHRNCTSGGPLVTSISNRLPAARHVFSSTSSVPCAPLLLFHTTPIDCRSAAPDAKMGTMISAPIYPADITSEAVYSYHPSCGYRYDNNNSSFTSPYNGTLRTCFEDVVLVPLPTWILLVLLLILFVPALVFTHKKSKSSGISARKTSLQRYAFSAQKRERRITGAKGGQGLKGEAKSDLEESNAAGQLTRGSHFTEKASGLWTALAVLFQILIIASLLMNVLEITRLALANRGVGLLPFTLAGIIVVFILYHVPLAPWVRPITNALVLVFWGLSLAFTSVQLKTLHALEPIEPRLNTEYHNADQQIDVGVIVGLYAIFVIVELLRFPMSVKEAKLVQS